MFQGVHSGIFRRHYSVYTEKIILFVMPWINWPIQPLQVCSLMMKYLTITAKILPDWGGGIFQKIYKISKIMKLNDLSANIGIWLLCSTVGGFSDPIPITLTGLCKQLVKSACTTRFEQWRTLEAKHDHAETIWHWTALVRT